MTCIQIKNVQRLNMTVVAVAAGWLGGHLTSVGLASTAQAAAPLASLTRLVIEDDIRQRVALYGMYVDGDGMDGRRRDLRALADTLMTPDVVSEVHPANGSTTIVLTGRDVVAKSRPELDPEHANRITGRHYLINTVFDSVTATAALIRTTAVYFDATKNLVGDTCAVAGPNACGGIPVKTYMWVYEMQWRKMPEGWQIYKNILRNDN